MIENPIPSRSDFQNLNGRVFGKLTVLFYAGRKSDKYSIWHCRCECGRERTVISSQLIMGRTTSCLPCFRHAPKKKIRSDLQDLVGKTFGRLTVVSYHHGVKKPTRHFWLCKCSCGESSVNRTDALTDGKVKSCGCLNVARKWLDQPIPESAICRICKTVFPLTTEHFYRHPQSKFGFNLVCRPCFRAEKNPLNKKSARDLRLQVLTAYSGSPPKCQCPNCSETHLEFLTIDHINGGGAKHRASLKGNNIYRWLRINKFPNGFRVLCINCNFSLGKYGYCPHCHNQSEDHGSGREH